ncbi:MAG: hypothetical protein AAB801_01750 [Patescibacteria group bacterium]
MITIRFFKTREDAERARQILEKAGFDAEVSEDKFNNVPIQKFGVRARYRLNVSDEDFYPVTAFLAKKIRAGRLK